jgi:hypothetical protein
MKIRVLQVPTVSMASIVPNSAARVESSVEAVAASIQHLEEVPTASMALLMSIPMVADT